MARFCVRAVGRELEVERWRCEEIKLRRRGGVGIGDIEQRCGVVLRGHRIRKHTIGLASRTVLGLVMRIDEGLRAVLNRITCGFVGSVWEEM